MSISTKTYTVSKQTYRAMASHQAPFSLRPSADGGRLTITDRTRALRALQYVRESEYDVISPEFRADLNGILVALELGG